MITPVTMENDTLVSYTARTAPGFACTWSGRLAAKSGPTPSWHVLHSGLTPVPERTSSPVVVDGAASLVDVVTPAAAPAPVVAVLVGALPGTPAVLGGAGRVVVVDAPAIDVDDVVDGLVVTVDGAVVVVDRFVVAVDGLVVVVGACVVVVATTCVVVGVSL
jgi:hypothetical protein